MKRNETILVYAVTGLLLVILLVAVMFGESKPALANRGDGASDGESTKVAALPGVAPARSMPEDGNKTAPGVGGDSVVGTGRGGTAADRNAANAGGSPAPAPGVAKSPIPKGSEPGGNGTPGPGSGTPGGTPPVDLSATKPTADKSLEDALGTSRRSGAFRVVNCRRGDTLRAVVERWCGDATLLPEAEVVNENLVAGAIPTVREVVVPWVDPEAILAARTRRAAEVAKVEHAKGQLYALAKGDSLWKLGKRAVRENNMVPAWIERFKQLNPEITDPSVLVVGQKVRLPR